MTPLPCRHETLKLGHICIEQSVTTTWLINRSRFLSGRLASSGGANPGRTNRAVAMKDETASAENSLIIDPQFKGVTRPTAYCSGFGPVILQRIKFGFDWPLQRGLREGRQRSHVVSTHWNARSRGACRKGKSCERIIRPSGSIHTPRTGRNENTPPRMSSADTRIRIIRLDGRLSQRKNRHSRDGRYSSIRSK